MDPAEGANSDTVPVVKRKASILYTSSEAPKRSRPNLVPSSPKNPIIASNEPGTQTSTFGEAPLRRETKASEEDIKKMQSLYNADETKKKWYNPFAEMEALKVVLFTSSIDSMHHGEHSLVY